MTELTYLDVRKLTDGGYEKLCSALSEERRAKAEAHMFRRGKLLSAAAGYLLRRALKERGLNAEAVKIVYGEHGKPYLADGAFYFNLSHSGDIAVCAVSDCEVGVDVQKIKPVTRKLMTRVCTPDELNSIDNAEEGNDAAFCRLWTVKESFIKQLGAGLSLPPLGLETEIGGSVRIKKDGAYCDVCFKEYPLEGYRVTACAKRGSFSPHLREIEVG